MHVFGSHTFSLINANNERYWVKSHFKTQQGIKDLTDAEALIAKDRESHQRGDYYTQPGRLFRLMNKEQLAALFGNTARAIGDAPHGDQDPPYWQLL